MDGFFVALLYSCDIDIASRVLLQLLLLLPIHPANLKRERKNVYPSSIPYIPLSCVVLLVSFFFRFFPSVFFFFSRLYFHPVFPRESRLPLHLQSMMARVKGDNTQQPFSSQSLFCLYFLFPFVIIFFFCCLLVFDSSFLRCDA